MNKIDNNFKKSKHLLLFRYNPQSFCCPQFNEINFSIKLYKFSFFRSQMISLDLR
jgi:hypothetical protein